MIIRLTKAKKDSSLQLNINNFQGGVMVITIGFVFIFLVTAFFLFLLAGWIFFNDNWTIKDGWLKRLVFVVACPFVVLILVQVAHHIIIPLVCWLWKIIPLLVKMLVKNYWHLLLK
jgi:hypothetical protein